jgi:DsbC/DsbD-like thiol-disulfide interchange protein
MEKGWHTYWKNPGDAGMPTRIEWDLPDGFVAEGTRWPCPERFEMSGLVSYGYEGQVVLLSDFRAPQALKPGAKVEIYAHAEWLVCKEECVAGQEDLSLELPVKDQSPRKEARWASLFDRTIKALPRFLDDWKISATWNEEKIAIRILPPASFDRKIRDIVFFPEQEGLIRYADPQVMTGEGLGFLIELRRSTVSAAVPSHLRGVLYIPSGWDRRGKVKALQVDVPLVAQENI